ncbi:MAG: ATP-binding protein [Phycisphaerales bacterium]
MANPPAQPERPIDSDAARTGGLLASMRIRKKLILLHTLFSLLLAAILLVALRPAIKNVVARAEMSQAVRELERSLPELRESADDGAVIRAADGGRIELRSGTADQLALAETFVTRAQAAPNVAVPVRTEVGRAKATMWVTDEAGGGMLWVVSVSIPEARRAVWGLYVLVVLSLLAVYALVALALEMFVLPTQVYGPIRALLLADAAVREGDRQHELIPERSIPADELGEIMRSRNESIVRIRTQEQRLADALERLETVAADLKRKNHLLETARRNLEGADRLASLGMMSAGIAHELNTPLAVAKGIIEKLDGDPSRGLSDAESRLLVRVIGRLERLSEGLLDFARVREPGREVAGVRTIVDDALQLVRLDRDTESSGIELANDVPEDLAIACDADRLVQVFVNLVRNAADAVRAQGAGGSVRVSGRAADRDGSRWALLLVRDTGPGIEPEMLSRLFEPFASTKLDARGTGLGLAVSEGIVREHGGTIIARNRADRGGAEFEVMLPMESESEPAGVEHGAAPAEDGAEHA